MGSDGTGEAAGPVAEELRSVPAMRGSVGCAVMTMRNSHRLKFGPALAVAVSLALTACSDSGALSSDDTGVCGDQSWCSGNEEPGLYHYVHADRA